MKASAALLWVETNPQVPLEGWGWKGILLPPETTASFPVSLATALNASLTHT